MAGTMQDGENTIVLVVGDEENTKDDRQIRVPYPITIKIEPLDESADKAGNKIFKSPAHTEEKENNKDVYDIEYLEEDNIKEEVRDDTEEYNIEYLEDISVEFEADEQDDDQDYSDHEKSKTNKMSLRKSTPKRKTQQRKTQRRKTLKPKTPQKKTPHRKTPQKKAPQKKTPQRKTPQKKTPQTNTPDKNRPQKFNSFVDQLRKEYPELAEDEELLIEHLVGIMRKTKAPNPPPDFYRVKVEEGQVKYECTLCDMEKETLPMASRHYQFKHGECYLVCYACGVTYRNTPALYKHEKRCLGPDGRLVLIARGHYLGRKGRGRPFTTTTKFITANTPTAKKEKSRLLCTKCPASFVHRENLVAHENSHQGVRPFRCNHCSVAYTSYPALKRHLRLHGDYRYICDHCGRKFKLKPALVSHIDSHRPMRKHGCLYCERRFTQKTALRHHINKVHLNLPAAHGCPVCPKRYARLSHVKEHMDRAHGLTMITRTMYYQALPSMTDTQFSQATELFNFELTQKYSKKEFNQNPEHILPDKSEVATVTRRVIIITKKKPDENGTDEDVADEDVADEDVADEDEANEEVAENTEPDSDLTYTVIEIETKPLIKEEGATPKEKETKIPKLKKIKKLPQRKREVVVPEPSVKVDEEIDDDDLCNIESKRKKKTVSPAPEKKKPDDEMYKIVRDIKSTLTNRKKAINIRAEKKKPTQNFYELKREFMNQLKSEIEIPEAQEEKPVYLIPDRKSSENLVPGTEIPENHVTWTTITENLSPQKKKATDDEATDDEEWKVYKDVSGKNKVIADFLEYMKSGVVPKHVPILRRGRQNKEK